MGHRRRELKARLRAQGGTLLGVERVGVDDDFFALGGHSLIATRAASRNRESFGGKVTVRDLFDTPTVVALARRLDESISVEITPALEALIPMHAVEAELSFAQQRLWFLDQYEPGSPLYNIPSAQRLEGRLDVAALERAFAEVIRRHASLRTTIQVRDGKALQVIAPTASIPLEVEDLRHLPPEERQREARRLALEEGQRPFDLARGPLLRTRLLRLGEDEHVLLATMHHIISDGWSVSVFIQEVVTLYASFVAGRPSPLPALPIQYSDYATWQREWLQGEVLEKQLTYWKQQLEGAPAVLELPLDRPRTADSRSPGALLKVELPLAVSRGLTALCRAEGATLFMGLLAGFQALLARYSGQEDVAVGTPIAGRHQKQTEGLIGFFVNTLVLRTKLDGDPTFRELLARVKDVTVGAYAHQDVPFEKLVEVLQPPRQPGVSPFFQVALVLLNTPPATARLPGLNVEALDIDTGRAKFDLTLTFMETPQGLIGNFEYRTDLFDAATLTRMMEHLRVLLEGAVARPTQRLSALAAMTGQERRRVLVEWNATRKGFPHESSVHALFEAQAARTPDAVAVEFEGQRLTYAALERRANQLANHLRAQGVRRGDRVALYVERSLEMVVGVLGVLKAGAAYVPLDPSAPRERLAFMLDDTRVARVLTLEGLAGKLPPGGPGPLCLDSQWAEVATAADTAPDAGATAEDLAYVMYTSGSTGRPKGVCIPHRGVVRLVMGTDFAKLGPDEVFLQFAPLAFDASTFELWGCLLHGGRLVVFDRQAPTLEELGRALERHGITTLWLTAALFEQMAASQPEALGRVRQVLAGGDVLPPARVREHVRRAGKLVNGYGPTEGTTFTTCHVVTNAEEVGHAVSIGKPIANTRVYVLDENLRPVPVGMPGELFISGDGLAWGYLQRPDLTAERFIPHPYGDVPGARLYRSGDVARWLPDGRLQFLGRRDAQVKIRGFRIELGEVEVALRDVPGVRDAAAAVREDTPGDRRLVGYVVPGSEEGAPGSTLDLAAVRAHLQSRLPEYMVPPALVRLDALPLTSSGKLDRRRLPAPDADSIRGEAPFTAPRTPLEETLAELFASVLKLPRLSVTDSFFTLGGHSLLATQVVTRLRAALGVEVALRELFDAPTVAALAQRLEGRVRPSARRAATPSIARRMREAELSFAQQRLWFLDQYEPGSPLYNIPAALRLEGRLDAAALERTFAEIIRRHQSLRTTIQVREGKAFQVISPTVGSGLEVEDLRHLPPEERRQEALRLAREEARRPFDLARGPLLRTRLLRLDEDEHVLLVTMHHIISDGWSVSVFIQEVAALYAAFVAGRPSPLPALPIQYADYAAWQRKWLQGEVLETQLSYWKKQLEGAPAVLELPLDRPRTADTNPPGAMMKVELPLAVSQGLTALCNAEGATLFMGLLAGLQALLARYSGQEDVSVGAPIAGRNHGQTEGLIGFFVNTLVLRTKLDGDPTFRELLARVKEVTLGAYSHQDVPFEKLVEVLQPPRQLGLSPLFQVTLVLLNTPSMTPALPGVKLEALDVDSGRAKFDLTLSMIESPKGLTGNLEYRTDLFDAATAARMMEHLRVLLESVVARPTQRLSDLPLMTGQERRRMLMEWNATRKGFPHESSVHALFEAQAARTPDAVAVEFEGQRLTYAALERRANQLANHLRAQGMRRGDRVALYVERSLELVVGVLGVLKAGAAYVPLDPSAPRERLAFMLDDTRVARVLTLEGLAGKLPPGGPGQLCLDSQWAEVATAADTVPAAGVTAEDLAYVMYTSGSTGRPKGVCIPHRGVVRLVMGTDFAKLGPEEVFLQLAPLAFDASTFELWGCLLHGGRLVVFDRQAPTLEELGRALERHGITTLWLTAALFEQMAASQPEALGRVRQVLAGGDVLPPARVREHVRRAGKLVNGYGPTEGTTFTTCHVVTNAEEVGHAVSIGKPIANTRVYLLDGNLRPVPVGMPGELFISGDGLAWGYLRRPDLTAERFIPHPYSDAPGARLYRSGDLARWLPDGRIQFLGRRDAQVKIRGFRIELGEIEGVLIRHSTVKEAAVLARDDMAGGKALVAYVVLESPPPSGEGRGDGAGASGFDATDLRAYLKETLPEYMVPTAFVALPALPVTPNGKLDRRALPHPDMVGARQARAYVAPRTPTEEVLARLVGQLLRVEKVGIHDDFFALGGHSLLATQFLSRVRAELGAELPLRTLFAGPTVAELARSLEAGTPDAAQSPPPLVRAARERAPTQSFAQERLWKLFKANPRATAYNMPGAYRLKGDMRVDALQAAIQAMLDRHESLRTTYGDEDGRPVQYVAASLRFELPCVDLRGREDPLAEALRLVEEEARQPFDLAKGPLVRGMLLRLEDDEYLFLFTKHHILSDGWSEGVILREVAALYTAFVRNEPNPLPPLKVQYADYSMWIRSWLSGRELEARLGYWRTALAGAPTQLNLPTDKPRPATRTFNGTRHSVALGKPRSDALNALCQRERVTPFMALLSLFGTVLCHRSRQDQVVIGSPVANRLLPELEPLVGFFVNGLPLRVDLRGEPTFRQLLARTRDTTLGAYAHQEVPLDLVMDALGVERRPSRSPLFQAMFALQNAPMEARPLPGLTLIPTGAPHRGASTYELTLDLSEQEDGFAGAWEFNTDLFEPATVERLSDDFLALLDVVLANPEQPVVLGMSTRPLFSGP